MLRFENLDAGTVGVMDHRLSAKLLPHGRLRRIRIPSDTIDPKVGEGIDDDRHSPVDSNAIRLSVLFP